MNGDLSIPNQYCRLSTYSSFAKCDQTIFGLQVGLHRFNA